VNYPEGHWQINQGVMNTGLGSVNFNGPVSFGPDPTTGSEPDGRKPSHAGRAGQWHLGVITVLSEETMAVSRVLARACAYRQREHSNGLRFEEATIDSAGKHVKVVATRALETGQLSASIAFDRLCETYAPAVVAMTGIAGSIHQSVRLGDVVVAYEVISYDQRKETPAGASRRGTSLQVPATVRHAINNFFSDNGEPCQVSTTDPDGTTRTFSVRPGIIGSGNAVVADAASDIRKYVASFNDKTLALETETGGIGQAFYEKADGSAATGWLAIRGISDHADPDKDDRFHDIAAWHAAVVLERLAPYLVPGN
jgi:adenosylhomocysteine nucleosidase